MSAGILSVAYVMLLCKAHSICLPSVTNIERIFVGGDMDFLSGIPTPIAVLCLAAVFGAIGWVARGIGFIAGRWVTRSPTKERADYLHTVTDLGLKLRQGGMTIEEVRALEAVIGDCSVSSSSTAKKVVEEIAEDVASETSHPEEFYPNIVMKARAGAAYEVAQARLQQVLLDVQILLSEKENAAFDVAQSHWVEYREALENCALLEYEGGTHATLAMVFAGMNETERRTEEIQRQILERSSR
jgi:uncharacterized protein YecT (DUF1311 family)